MRKLTATGNWIQTRHGRAFSLTDPQADQVSIEDIAHSLAHQCRFTGHTRVPYSVAEHCVRCSLIVDPAFALDALLHDAAEAYLGDLSSPLKREIGTKFERIQEQVELVIAEKFGVLYPFPRAVIRADFQMLAVEMRDLVGQPIDDWISIGSDVFNVFEEVVRIIEPWPADYARHRFLLRFGELASESVRSQLNLSVAG